jgi:hypothetical protein
VRRRWLAFGLAALLLLAAGIAVGRHTAEPRKPSAQPAATVTVTVPAETHAATETPKPSHADDSPFARTPEGAAAAATAYLSVLSGPALLDRAAVSRTLNAIVSTGSRVQLVSAYQTAADRAREQLGVDATSASSVVLRAASVGYRVDGFQPSAASVSVWRVGVVGSGASVTPRQSWRTETVSLVWERGTWKIDAVRSSPGPTPPLAATATDGTDLAAVIPTFEEFSRELP